MTSDLVINSVFSARNSAICLVMTSDLVMKSPVTILNSETDTPAAESAAVVFSESATYSFLLISC